MDEKNKIEAFDIDQVGKRGQMREALETALDCIRTGADSPDLYYVAAKIAFQLNDIEKAQQLIDKLLVLDPDHINGWLLFGEIHAMKADFARALYGHKMAEELFPALEEFGILINYKPTLDSENEREDVTAGSIFDDSVFDTITFAEICVKQGYYNKALKIYTDLLEKNPDNNELRKKIEELKKKMGKYA